MKCYLLTFRSVTYAQRAETITQDLGLRCRLQRTPKWMEEQGCGYALRLWTQELEPLLIRLRTRGLNPKRIYEIGPTGAMGEVMG